MILFDTDVFSLLMSGRYDYVARASLIPEDEQSIAIVTAEEILRGRFNQIRKAESNPKSDLTVPNRFFDEALTAIQATRRMPYTPAAHALVLAWRAAKLRVGTYDMRIAAIALANGATLVTRNRRDFDRIPGLSLVVWPVGEAG